MKKVKISVIVPCYNVEKYVEKCITSLANQTLKELEIIAIDDGSSDKTLDLLKKLEKLYSNLKVIHKENEGVSIARNVGLKEASGEYIGFLDSDDWVNSDMYEKLYNKAIEGNYDIVACDTTAVYPDKNVVISSNITDGNTRVEDLMINAYAVIWNKIYRRDIIEGIKFKEHMNFCEDVEFLFMVYSRIKKVGAVNECLHNYLQRPGSLTYVYDQKLYQLIDCLDDIITFYKEEGKFDKYRDVLEYSYVRYLYATFIKRLAKTKNIKQFKKGVNFVIDKVHKSFPNYKKNKYLVNLNPKNIYLRFFNSFVANVIFFLEKNKMN